MSEASGVRDQPHIALITSSLTAATEGRGAIRLLSLGLVKLVIFRRRFLVM